MIDAKGSRKKITPTVSQDGVSTTLFLDLKDLVANIVGWTNLLSDSQIQLCQLCSIPSGAPTIRFNSESMIGWFSGTRRLRNRFQSMYLISLVASNVF